MTSSNPSLAPWPLLPASLQKNQKLIGRTTGLQKEMFREFDFCNGLQGYTFKSNGSLICNPVWSNGVFGIKQGIQVSGSQGSLKQFPLRPQFPWSFNTNTILTQMMADEFNFSGRKFRITLHRQMQI